MKCKEYRNRMKNMKCKNYMKSIEYVLRKNPLMDKYLSDNGIKLLASLINSVAFDMLYAIWEIICGIYYQSYWFITLGCYYLLLMLMHMILFRETHRRRKAFRYDSGEKVDRGKETESLEKEAESAGWKQYRTCGILLLLMNFILSGIVVLALVNHQGSQYAGYLIYAMATYTFYKTGMTIRDLVKYRRSQDPVVMASKIINFVSVMISMLSLEIAMILHFGEEEEFFRMMTIMTGTGVCLVISATAIRMIITAKKEMG